MTFLLEKLQTCWIAIGGDPYGDLWEECQEEYLRLSEEALQTDPHSPQILVWCGRFCGHFSDEKKEYLNLVLLAISLMTFAGSCLAAINFNKSDEDVAEKLGLLNILSQGKYKRDPEINFHLAEYYFYEGDNSELAAHYANRILEAHDDFYSVQAHFILGNIAKKAEDWSNAIQHFEKVTEESSHYFPTCIALAKIMERVHDSERATNFYQQAYASGLQKLLRADLDYFGEAFQKADPEKWAIVGPLVENYDKTFSLENLDDAHLFWDIIPQVYHHGQYENLRQLRAIAQKQKFVLHAVNRTFEKDVIDLIHSFLYFMKK